MAGGLATVLGPHSYFRNWFQDLPTSVPLEAFFTLHSCIVSALAEVRAKEIDAANTLAQTYIE